MFHHGIATSSFFFSTAFRMKSSISFVSESLISGLRGRFARSICFFCSNDYVSRIIFKEYAP